MGTLTICPVSLKVAREFIAQHHRHNSPPRTPQHLVGVKDDTGKLVGVATTANPVSRHQDDGWTLEVKRCCTDGTPNAVSKLYGACRRMAKALGYRRMLTYTLESEPGTSLVASGWTFAGMTKDESNRTSANFASTKRMKPRTDLWGNDWQPMGPKKRWVIDLA